MLKHILALFCFIFLVSGASGQDRHPLTSLSLKEAVEIATRNHPEIQKSKYSIEAAEGRYKQDISLPPLNLSLSNEFIPNGRGLSNSEERSFEISQDFEFPTLYFTRGARASAGIKAAGSGLEQTLNSVRTSVKRSYYSAVAKLLLLKIAEENLSIAEEFNKKVQIRVNVGEGTNLELLTSKLQLTEAKSMIESARKEYLAALNELDYSLGYNKEVDFTNISLTDSLAYRPMKFSLDELTGKSLRLNPYIKQAEYELQSTDLNKEAAWMSLLPSFNASYMFQSAAGVPDYYGVSFGVSLPLWFMFDQQGKIEEADASCQMNFYELLNVKNSIVQRIKSAFIEYGNNEKQYTLYRDEIIPQAEEVFRTADLSYQAGEITYLEFLQAKFNTINSKINLVRSLYDYEEAIINLEESSGINLE